MRRLYRTSIWIILLFLLSALGYSVQQTGTVGTLPKGKSLATPGYYQVTRVTDGDTISANIAGKSESIRLIGIDTPEEKDPRVGIQCYALTAAQHMQDLVGGKSVRLEADPTDTDRDKYNRLLRYVYLPDGTFVNQVQVQQGYGFAYTLFPNNKLAQFKAWEAEARQNNRGLWGACQIHKDGEKEQTQVVQ